ncbi:MAG: squalene synthase HpnC [Streptosporangiales bacterium]|nr:squalene synthase HpnC [Streptosporangiales bacterium]
MDTENFPVALRVLPADVRADLVAIYRFARYVDDVGDESAGDRSRGLDAVDADLDVLYTGGRPALPAVSGLRAFVDRCATPEGPFRRLVRANRQDQVVSRYATFDQLRDYCRLSADPVGELVLHVFGCATPERVALSDRVCTALQVIEHLQDVREDYERGRIYLPKDDMDRFGVVEKALGASRATFAVRRLVAFEARRAGRLLDEGTPLLRTLHGWARVCVTGYVAGGRAALAALRRAGYDPLPEPPKAGRADLLRAAARVVTTSSPTGGG